MNRQKFISALTIGLVSMTASAKRLLKLPPQQLTGGGCDGCDLIYQGMPAKLSNTTYLPDWHEAEAKMIVEGTIYFKDGSTPAPGVIFYLYHTDSTGHYSKAAGQVHGLRHGHIRGWIKTGNDGKYWFYTGKPAAYPNRDIPAHIHPVIKQPGMNEYYLDDYFF
jgi:protocatechuate 3,4-dioxygenase beta subunit